MFRQLLPSARLTARLTVLECIPSRSKPDRGVVRAAIEMRNQHAEVVVTSKGLSLFGRRPSL